MPATMVFLLIGVGAAALMSKKKAAGAGAGGTGGTGGGTGGAPAPTLPPIVLPPGIPGMPPGGGIPGMPPGGGIPGMPPGGGIPGMPPGGGIPPGGVEDGGKFVDGCRIDPGMPPQLIAAQNDVLKRPDANPALLRWLADSIKAAGYPLAAQCLQGRAVALEKTGAPSGPTGQGPSSTPPPWWSQWGLPWPPAAPGQPGQSGTPAWWPPGLPVPPWPGGGNLPGGAIGDKVPTTVRANDIPYGYARYYEQHGVGAAAANLATLAAMNPDMHSGGVLWANWQIGRTFYLPSGWVALAGLPPLPTSNYFAAGGGGSVADAAISAISSLGLGV